MLQLGNGERHLSQLFLGQNAGHQKVHPLVVQIDHCVRVDDLAGGGTNFTKDVTIKKVFDQGLQSARLKFLANCLFLLSQPLGTFVEVGKRWNIVNITAYRKDLDVRYLRMAR